MSEKKVHLICQSCSEHNGATWRNDKTTADALLGKCQVCGEVKIITHIHYWKDIDPTTDFKVPSKKKEAPKKEVPVEDTADKVEVEAKAKPKPSKETAAKNVSEAL